MHRGGEAARRIGAQSGTPSVFIWAWGLVRTRPFRRVDPPGQTVPSRVEKRGFRHLCRQAQAELPMNSTSETRSRCTIWLPSMGQKGKGQLANRISPPTGPTVCARVLRARDRTHHPAHNAHNARRSRLWCPLALRTQRTRVARPPHPPFRNWSRLCSSVGLFEPNLGSKSPPDPEKTRTSGPAYPFARHNTRGVGHAQIFRWEGRFFHRIWPKSELYVQFGLSVARTGSSFGCVH